MGFFDALAMQPAGAQTAPTTPAVPVPQASATPSFFGALNVETPAANTPTPAPAKSKYVSLQPPTDIGDEMGQGILHGLARGWQHALRFGSDAARWTGFEDIARHEPAAMQHAFAQVQQAMTPNMQNFPRPPGTAGTVGNFIGEMTPSALAMGGAGSALDAALPVAEGLGPWLGRSLLTNALGGALIPGVKPSTGALAGAAFGPAIEGATAGALNLGAWAADRISPYMRQLLQSLRSPTEEDAARMAAGYIKPSISPADAAALKAAQEPVPGVVHTPSSLLPDNEEVKAKAAAARSRNPALFNEQGNANTKAIFNHVQPVLGTHPDVNATSVAMHEQLLAARDAARNGAAADRAPLDAIKGDIHVGLNGMKQAYDRVANSLGAHTRDLLPAWLKTTFEDMPEGMKTSYTNAESMLARLKSDAAGAPQDTTLKTIIGKMRDELGDSLYNTTDFFDKSGKRLEGDYAADVKDRQSLANKSWRQYRQRFPNGANLTPAQRLIRDAVQGRLNPTDFGDRVLSKPEYWEAFKNAVSGHEATPAAGFFDNGSGESSASQEAINRSASETSKGQHRFRITPSGSVIPEYGVDAVDATAPRGHVIVQRGIGKDAYTVMSHGTDLTPANAKRLVDGATEKLNAASAERDAEYAQGATSHATAESRAKIAQRMAELDAERTPDPQAIAAARAHYSRRLLDKAFDSRGTLDQTPILKPNAMTQNRLPWAEPDLLQPHEAQALTDATEAQKRNLRRYESVARGQSPTEFLRQQNKQAEVHPLLHIGAALSGHGIAPVALTKGAEVLSQRYASKLSPMVEDLLQRAFTDPDTFQKLLGVELPPEEKPLLQRLRGSEVAKGATRKIGHAAALLGALGAR